MTALDLTDPRAELQHEIATLRRRSTTVVLARAASYVAYAWVIASLIILAFGFLLQLFGANPEAEFTQWVYRHLAEVMEPFRAIFPRATTAGGATVDVSILFAMFVYSLVALAVRGLIDWLTTQRDTVRHSLERQEALERRSRPPATTATAPQPAPPAIPRG